MSQPRVRVLAFACGVLLLAGVVSAATYDDDSVTVEQSSTDLETIETTTTAVAGGTPATEPSTTDTTVAPDTTLDAGTPPSTAPRTTTPPTAPPTTEAEIIGTTPGTYTYDTTGTANGEDVSGTSTLEVSRTDTDGRQTHVQSAPDGKTVTVYRHAPEGTYLESLSLESDQGSFSMTATTPYLVIPTDAAMGTKTSGRLQGEGLTADVTFTISELGPETTTATLHVDLSGKIQGFDVDGTMDSTIVARSSDQLPLETAAKSDIAVGGGLFRIQSDTRSVLRR